MTQVEVMKYDATTQVFKERKGDNITQTQLSFPKFIVIEKSTQLNPTPKTSFSLNEINSPSPNSIDLCSTASPRSNSTSKRSAPHYNNDSQSSK